MRKFKHKILGLIASNEYNRCSDGYYQIGDGEVVRASIIENSSDWVEVKDEFPKIISFRNKKDLFIFNRNQNGDFIYSIDKLLQNSNTFEIYQVATSPTDVWTVGDRIRHRCTNSTGNITKINLIDGDIFFETTYCESRKGTHIDNAIKLSTSIFTTLDNIEIFEEDSFWFIDSSFEIGKGKCTSRYTPIKGIKEFSTRDNAEKYIEQNKPKFSIKDIEEALDSLEIPSWMNSTYIPTQFKQKLGI